MQTVNCADTIESRSNGLENPTGESNPDKTQSYAAAPSAMEIKIIRTIEELRAFLPEWEEFLSGGVIGDCFENDPVYLECVLADQREWSPFIIVCKREGKIECIAAFRMHRKKLKLQLGPIKIASLPIHNLKLCGDDFIYRQGISQQEAVAAVFAVLQREKCHFDVADFSYPDCSGALWKHCQGLSRPGSRSGVIATLSAIDRVPQVRLPYTHEAYMASLNPNTRQALRRNTRRVLKDGRGKLIKYTRPDQVPELLPLVDEVYKTTWQAKTLGYHSRNTERGRKRFELIASRGWLRSYVLCRDEQPIAYELGYHYSGRYYLTETGFDPKHSEFGPGMVLIHLIIEDLFKDNLPLLVDFGFGDSAYKHSFTNAGHEAAYAYIAFSHYGRYLLRLQKALDHVSARGRSILSRLRMDWLVRRVLKFKRWSVN